MNQSHSAEPIATCHIWADATTASWCVVRVFSNDRCATEIYANGTRALLQQCDSMSSALNVAQSFRSAHAKGAQTPRRSAA